MPTKLKIIVFLVLLVVLLGTGASTYFGARNAHESFLALMHKDAVSLANIFSEGARGIYELQKYEIARMRFRLERHALQVEQSGKMWKQLPPDVILAILLDDNVSVVDTFGLLTPQRVQWIDLLPDIIAPVIESLESDIFFGLDPEFPVSSEPIGYARRINNGSILVLFAAQPFARTTGIGFLARQLAETPSVRYIILQNRKGILVASKDVYRATTIESDEFIRSAIEKDFPESRFIDFEGERVFELVYPFPTLGEFSGILRVGLPLSAYREISGIVLWTVIVGIVLAFLAIAAGITLINIGGRMLVMKQKHQELLHLQSLGEVAASVAHEIRNPLNAIAISLQRLQAEFQTTSEHDEYDKLIFSARSQISRIDSIVREFIAIAGSISPVRTDAEVTQFLQSICAQFKQQIPLRKIRFECNIDEDIAHTQWDWEKVGRAISNVLKNAFEAVDEGGLVTLNTAIQANRIVIKVFNQGKPIPKDNINSIFKPFVSGKSDGTGIGLFYAYRIIDAHGGTIKARNIFDGVEFMITLPI